MFLSSLPALTTLMDVESASLAATPTTVLPSVLWGLVTWHKVRLGLSRTDE